MTPKTEPHNPLYLLALLVGLLFVMTALAYALVPVLEQKALDAGEVLPPSSWRDALRADGWKWLLSELAVLILLCLGSMWLDRLRGLQSEREQRTIPPVGTSAPHETPSHENQERHPG
jgi:hypothetical protein